jgi:hypothetical protein
MVTTLVRVFIPVPVEQTSRKLAKPEIGDRGKSNAVHRHTELVDPARKYYESRHFGPVSGIQPKPIMHALNVTLSHQILYSSFDSRD